MENKELIKKLKKEQDDLNEKLWNLFFFIDDQEDSQTISSYHLNLLKAQRDVMCKYSDILEMRISDLERDYFTEDGVIELAIGNYEPNELLPDKPSKEFLEWLDPVDDSFERHLRHVKMILATIYPVKLEKEG